jgi:hypothetical protein
VHGIEARVTERGGSHFEGVHLKALEKWLTRGLSYAKAGERMVGGWRRAGNKQDI